MSDSPCTVVAATDEGAVEAAADAVRHGGLVGLPTETVYGLAGDALSDRAVERIFAVKDRPTTHPLILHLADASWLADWADAVSGAAALLARECWPGPLTLLLPAAPHVPRAPLGGRSTAAFRVPAHDAARSVIGSVSRPVAAPSANRFGRVSPTTAAHVCADLGGDVDLVLDGGPSVLGIESTILDLSGRSPQVLRHGALPVEDLESLLGTPIERASGASRAPGMLASHYAPSCSVRLADGAEEAESMLADVTARGERARILPHHRVAAVYAATLYEELRRCDRDALDTVIAVLPPAQGLGRAIRDRLEKAAAAR
ncbi:MAG: threonylcarbamoyl-AMP synthase [Acidobacteria bacterium]|nr:threonylcarbamoyl-AMP synthase [Acidobacteriota bacterium]